MSPQSLSVMATLAMAANAFMIPSTMSLPNMASVSLPLMYDTHSRLIAVHCPECSMPDGTTIDNSLVSFSP